MYVIRKISNVCLFYVDRTKTIKFWWSYLLKYAMIFTSKEAAQKICDNLKYGKCVVITLREAKSLRQFANEKHEERVTNAKLSEDFEDQEHPFSSNALGQWQD